MSDRAHNIYDMFVGTLAFNAENAADYATIPMAATQFAIVQTAVDALEAFFAAQTSGERSAAVEQKTFIKAAIRRKLILYSKTARALNISDKGFDKLFHVPEGNNEGELLAFAKECVEQATTHSAAFATLGLAATTAADLQADIDAFNDAQTAKASGQAGTVGATAGINQMTDDGMDAEEILDAIVTNVYRDNPVKRAAWKTCRHVKRAPKKTPTHPTPLTP